MMEFYETHSTYRSPTGQFQIFWLLSIKLEIIWALYIVLKWQYYKTPIEIQCIKHVLLFEEQKCFLPLGKLKLLMFYFGHLNWNSSCPAYRLRSINFVHNKYHMYKKATRIHVEKFANPKWQGPSLFLKRCWIGRKFNHSRPGPEHHSTLINHKPCQTNSVHSVST